MCRKEGPKVIICNKKVLKQRLRRSVTSSVKEEIRETNFEKKRKIYNEKVTTTKPPKDIIDKTVNGIADQTDTALANFRKLMEENKRRELAKRKKSGDFDNMIGF